MKFNLSISRNSRDRVRIEVQCESSRTNFLELELSLEEYAQVITGVSHVEVEGSVKGLDNVGKKKVREDLSVVLPQGVYKYDRDPVKQYLKDNHSEEGWTLELSLSSQNSVKYDSKTDTHTVNYSVYKYVDVS